MQQSQGMMQQQQGWWSYAGFCLEWGERERGGGGTRYVSPKQKCFISNSPPKMIPQPQQNVISAEAGLCDDNSAKHAMLCFSVCTKYQ